MLKTAHWKPRGARSRSIPTMPMGISSSPKFTIFRKELGPFKASAERAIELNPRDTEAMAMLGILTALCR